MGQAHTLYFTNGGEVGLDLREFPRKFSVQRNDKVRSKARSDSGVPWKNATSPWLRGSLRTNDATSLCFVAYYERFDGLTKLM